MQSFVDLEVWKIGLELVKSVYKITYSFPYSEKNGLVSQLRRASTSILANLAEGYSRYTDADKAHKYIIARGECAEVHALLIMSKELGFITSADIDPCITLALRTGKLLSGLVQSFSRSHPSQP